MSQVCNCLSKLRTTVSKLRTAVSKLRTAVSKLRSSICPAPHVDSKPGNGESKFEKLFPRFKTPVTTFETTLGSPANGALMLRDGRSKL